MKKLTRNEILNLPDRSTLHVKLTRLWMPDPKLIAQGPATVLVQRNARGKFVGITTDLQDWAEGNADDVFANGDVVVEDYMMELYHEEAPQA